MLEDTNNIMNMALTHEEKVMSKFESESWGGKAVF